MNIMATNRPSVDLVVQHTVDLFVQHTVINKLAAAVKYNYDELISAREGCPLSTVAWLARNLLELLIWTEFCIKSPENANRFYIDAVRDFDDVIRRVSTTDLKAHPEAEGLLKEFRDARTELAGHLPPGELDKRYKEVRTAAQDLGKLPLFEKDFKALSKFAHPTALAIMIEPIPDERGSLIRNSIIKHGLEMASEAAAMMRAFINSRGTPPNPTKG
jgi:hypothetical protein